MAERPTPTDIAVCTLISLQSDPSSQLYSSEDSRRSKNHINEQSLRKLSSLIQQLVLSFNGNTVNTTGSIVGDTLSLSHLLSVIESDGGGKRVAVIVRESLTSSSCSIDTVVDLFTALRAGLTNGTVDKSSAHGIFMRQRCLGFDELPFEAVGRLWKALVSYVAEDDKYLEGDSRNGWSVSLHQIEKTLQRRCLSLDQYLGTRSFSDTESELLSILDDYPELPAAHFLRFLNCLHHGERIGGLDSLHRYFDYAMIHERRHGKGSEKISVMSCAAILLAALHYQFGDDFLSLKATEEAIRVAQQSGDGSCVAYALGWLHCNAGGQVLHSQQSEELLRRCATRARDHNLPTLASGAFHSLTRHVMTTPFEENSSWNDIPALAWQNLASASVINDGYTQISQGAESENSMATLGSGNLVASGVWESLGNSPLSSLQSAVALHCYGDWLSSSQFSMAIHKIACAALHGPGNHLISHTINQYGTIPFPTRPLYNYSTPSHAQTHPRSHTTIYSLSLQQIKHLRNKYQSPSNIDVGIHTSILLLQEWAIQRNELSHAQSLSYLLQSLSPLPAKPQTMEVLVQSFSLYALLLYKKRFWEQSKLIIQKLLSISQKNGLRLHYARLLLLFATIQLESSSPIGALPPLLECLSVSETSSMDSVHASALYLLALLHVRLGNTKRANVLLNAALPQLLQKAPIVVQGGAWVTLAKNKLAEASQRTGSKRVKNRLLSFALIDLEKAIVLFRKIQHVSRLREIYYIQARTYQFLGQLAKRDVAANNYQYFTKPSVSAASWPVSYDVLVSVMNAHEMERMISRC